jgi:hypothetical protein
MYIPEKLLQKNLIKPHENQGIKRTRNSVSNYHTHQAITFSNTTNHTKSKPLNF